VGNFPLLNYLELKLETSFATCSDSCNNQSINFHKL